jgi:hypothetical protein
MTGAPHLHLPGGILAGVSARREATGIRVTLIAVRSPARDAHDERYREAIADHLHAIAMGSHPRVPLPLTGAQRYLADVDLVRPDGSCPPDDLIKHVGGLGAEWTVHWTSTSWQPSEVLLIGPAGLRRSVRIDEMSSQRAGRRQVGEGTSTRRTGRPGTPER